MEETTENIEKQAANAASAQERAQAGGKARKPSFWERYVGPVLSGSILTKAEVRRQYPYILFMAVLMFLYIANGYRIQKLHRQKENLTKELKEMRNRSLTLASMRMSSTRQSEIIKELEKRGIPLIEATEPPRVIDK